MMVSCNSIMYIIKFNNCIFVKIEHNCWEVLIYTENMLLRKQLHFLSNSMLIVVSTANLCSNLTSPSNGEINKVSVEFGDSVRYNCSYGYMLVGKSTRLCDADCTGNQCQLSGVKPTCESALMYCYFSFKCQF